MKTNNTMVLLVLAFFIPLPEIGQAIDVILEEGVNSYTGVRDTTVYEENVNNANGGGAHLFAGNTNTGNLRRSFVAFDLSPIPAGATITAASLTLTVSIDPFTWTATETFTLRRMTSDWGEGTADAAGNESGGTAASGDDATWNSNFDGTSLWTNAGGDFLGSASGSADISNSAVGNQGTFTGAGMVQDLQAWLDGTADNYGWALLGNESTTQTAFRFYSSDEGTVAAGQRPSLSVSYEPATSVEGWLIY